MWIVSPFQQLYFLFPTLFALDKYWSFLVPVKKTFAEKMSCFVIYFL